MALVCEGQKINIFRKGQSRDLVPRIKSVRKVSIKKQGNDEPQNFDIANIEFYTFADQRKILSHRIRKIEVFLSKKDIKYYRQKFTPFDEINHRDQQIVNDTLYDYSYSMHDLIAAHFDGVYKVGVIDPYQKIRRIKRTGTSGLINKTDRELFGTTKVYKTVQKRENSKFKRKRSGDLNILNQTIPPEDDYPESENYGRKFRRQYRRAIKKGIDPMILLQERDHYVCTEESVKGVSKISKPRKSPLRSCFTKYIRTAYADNTDLNFRIIEEEKTNRIARLKARVRMNSLVLGGLFSSGFEYLIFFAYDKAGNRIDSFGYKVDLQKMFDDFINPTLDFEIMASKNRDNNAITRIFNGEFQPALFNLYQKKFNANSSPLRSDYEKLSTNLIDSRAVKKLVNGREVKKTKERAFCSTKNVFQRVTFNHLGTELANSKAASVRAAEMPAEQINCKIIAKVDNKAGKERISIRLYDFTDEVTSFQVVRRRVRGNRGDNFKPVRQIENGRIVDSSRIILDGSPRESYVFYDEDVEDEELYEYAAILYDASGATTLSTNRFFEEYMKRDGILRVVMKPGSAKAMPPQDTSDESATVHQKFEITIRKSEDDVDKIINSLFGDNRALFNDDLKDIREGSNLVYGARVHRIDTHTGESSLLGVFRASKQKSRNEAENSDIPKDFRIVFTDAVPAYSKQIYKVEPYAVPPTQILDRLIEKLKYSAAKDISKRTASKKMLFSKGRIMKQDVVSKVGGKYASSTTKKGKVSSDLSYVEISRGDIFTEGYTGDMIYLEHRSMSRLPSFRDLKFRQSSVTPFYALDIEKRESRKISKNFMKVTFTADSVNSLVDFYVVLRAENNNPKIVIDGVVHSKDLQEGNESIFKYDYISEVKTKVGYISYFAVGISKIGTLSNILFLGDTYLRD
tara:strand:- start:789 stop:3527 length:2739 start_codon:yes stop_codon:yes gene_type:complete